jgi:class 3 adenylate cyclase/predicted ATPase
MAEERRLVTALFADISGFTPLADRLDPEQLVEIIDPIITRLSSVVGRYEGYVDKFAGDALLAFFGAPVSHEDDAQRALLVALDMQREMRAIVQEMPSDVRDLTLHVGINTGHVIARVVGSDVRLDYSVLGDAANLAQRLESAAPGGATYVGEATYRLTKSRFDLEPVGELALKGKAQPVAAWRLKGELSAVPAPSTVRMVGRRSELARVSEALVRLNSGSGGIVAVLGEAGIGKSRLLQAARQQAARAEIRWLDTRCLSYGAALAYWPYADLLRRLSGISRDTEPAEARRMLAELLITNKVPGADPFLQRLLGISVDRQTGGLEPEAFRRGLHRAVGELLGSMAARGPTVLAMEDIHWADASSQELTDELIRTMAQAPVLFVLSGRPEAGDAVRALLDRRPPEDRCELALDALDRDGVRELLGARLGGSPDEGLVGMLAERTAGNPFFIEETVRSLREEGALREHGGRWTTVMGWQPQSVPDTIEGVIAARLDRLTPADTATLELGAVIGRVVRRPLLAAVATEIPDLPTSLDRLVTSGFMDRVPNDPDHSVTFHHALVQTVAYNRMLRKRRRELHLRVADAGEAIYGAGDDFIDLLARHLYLAEAGGRAVDALLKAAARAERLFANAEAILHLERAIELIRKDAAFRTRHASALLELAAVEERAGRYESALQHYTEARDLSGEILAWRGMASTMRSLGRYDDALALVELALAQCERVQDPRPLWLERGWSLSLVGRLAEAEEALQQGLRQKPDSQDVEAGQLLLRLARLETLGGQLQSAVRHGREAERILRAHGDLPGLATALRLVGNAYSTAGNFQEAARTLEEGLALAERVGNAAELAGCLLNLGLVNTALGAYPDAERLNRRAIEEFERIGNASGQATAYGNLAEVLVKSDRLEEAERYVSMALRVSQSTGLTLVTADVTCTRAAIHMRRGDYGAAAGDAQLAAQLFLDMRAPAYAAGALELAAKALEGTGDRERAAECLRTARSLTESVGV